MSNIVDKLLTALGVSQLALLILQITVLHTSWWIVVIPTLIILGIFVVFIVCFGCFAYTMNRHG